MSDRPPTSVLLPTTQWTDACAELAAQLGDNDELLILHDGEVDGGTVAGSMGNQSPTELTHRYHVKQAARDAWPFFVETLPYLLLGMAVGAVIHGVVPVGVLRSVHGPENQLAVPLAALAGAPVYVSLSGMLPIAAALSERGIAIGTVLAFVIGGAGVSIPNLVLLNKLFEWRLLLIYAGTVVAIGTTVGIVFNLLLV